LNEVSTLNGWRRIKRTKSVEEKYPITRECNSRELRVHENVKVSAEKILLDNVSNIIQAQR